MHSARRIPTDYVVPAYVGRGVPPDEDDEDEEEKKEEEDSDDDDEGEGYSE